MTSRASGRTRTNAVHAVAALGAALSIATGATGCTVPVVGDLDDAQANRIVAALTGSGIAADKANEPGSRGHFRVEVPRDDGTRAAGVLAEVGLPAEKTPGVLEALGGNSLVPSRTVEHERLLVGVAGDLEHTLTGVDGVVSARVHLAVPRADPLALGPGAAPSASVLLRYRGARSPLTETEVQQLVSGAVPGLAPERVALITLAVPTSPPPADLVRVGPVSLPRDAARKVRLMVAGVALSNLALVACLLTLWTRVRKLRPRPPRADAPARDPR